MKVVGGLLLAVVAGLAWTTLSEAATCSLDFTFFPTGSEDANFPAQWSQTNQKLAKNAAKDTLLDIATDGTQPVSLQVSPISDLLSLSAKGDPLSPNCISVAAAAPGARRLASTQAHRARTLSAVAEPFDPRSVNYGLWITKTAQFTVSYTWNGKTTKLGPYKSATPAPRINITDFATLPDGKYCVIVNITLVKGSGTAYEAYLRKEYPIPTADISAGSTACVYKVAGKPNATLTFGSCGADLKVNVSDIVPASATGDKPLFQTVIHVYGNLLNDFKGDVQPAVTAPTVKNFGFWVEEDNVTAVPNLLQGIYTVFADAAFATRYPSLVGLGVAGKFGENDPYSGQAKYQGVQILPGAGLDISLQTVAGSISDLKGPTGPVPVGQTASFTWTVTGGGVVSAFLDNLPAPPNNPGKKGYVSPLFVIVKDTLNHTLRVDFVDSCGSNVSQVSTFGTFGAFTNGTGGGGGNGTTPETPSGAFSTAPALLVGFFLALLSSFLVL